EAGAARGVVGSRVPMVLRRLRRVVAHYGGEPRFVLASATIGNPAELAERLTGLPFAEVTADASPRGEKSFVLWDPPLVDVELGIRRSAISEASWLLRLLVEADVRTIAFCRSRKASDLVAELARREAGRGRGDRPDEPVHPEAAPGLRRPRAAAGGRGARGVLRTGGRRGGGPSGDRRGPGPPPRPPARGAGPFAPHRRRYPFGRRGDLRDRRRGHREPAGDGGRGPGVLDGPPGGDLPAPGRTVRGPGARPGPAGRPGAGQRRRPLHPGP